MSNTTEEGKEAEKKALAYLLKNKLRLIKANFQCRLGEIDLIMQEKKTLIFVEVRLRKNPNYATAASSVDEKKQKKLRRTAQYYLQQNHLTDKLACRFDVVAMASDLSIEWIQNAF